MTYEEALKTLEEKYIGIGSNDLFVFRKAAEAINKQIPKKPTHESSLQLPHTCPSCKNVIDRVESFFGHNVLIKEEFCRFCGQAIDWSDSE